MTERASGIFHSFSLQHEQLIGEASRRILADYNLCCQLSKTHAQTHLQRSAKTSVQSPETLQKLLQRGITGKSNPQSIRLPQAKCARGNHDSNPSRDEAQTNRRSHAQRLGNCWRKVLTKALVVHLSAPESSMIFVQKTSETAVFSIHARHTIRWIFQCLTTYGLQKKEKL